MNPEELLRTLTSEGVELWAEGGMVRFRAPERSLSPERIAAIASAKKELIELLSKPSTEELRNWQVPADLDHLQRLCPSLWHVVRTRDGKTGLLWGVTPHGAIVTFDPKGPLYTLDPAGVDLVR